VPIRKHDWPAEEDAEEDHKKSDQEDDEFDCWTVRGECDGWTRSTVFSFQIGKDVLLDEWSVWCSMAGGVRSS
jgi:hypothetical protein